MKHSSEVQIIDKLENIINNADFSKLDDVGSKIVGCTIVDEGIEPVYSEFPILEEIAELGASLEIEKDQKHQKAIFTIIKQKFKDLKDLSQV